jgi:hypothetical protein
MKMRTSKSHAATKMTKFEEVRILKAGIHGERTH